MLCLRYAISSFGPSLLDHACCQVASNAAWQWGHMCDALAAMHNLNAALSMPRPRRGVAFGHALPPNAPNVGMPALAMSPEQLQQILIAMRHSGGSLFPAPPGGVPWYPPAQPPQAPRIPEGREAVPPRPAHKSPASFRQFKKGFMSKARGRPSSQPQTPAAQAPAQTAAAIGPEQGARTKSTSVPVQDQHRSFPNAGVPLPVC